MADRTAITNAHQRWEQTLSLVWGYVGRRSGRQHRAGDQRRRHGGDGSGKIVTFYQNDAPTAEGVGDIWFDTNDGNKQYRWNGSTWEAVQDAGIVQAISDAATAQETADGKIVTFYQTEQPTAEGVGDIWFDTNDGNKQYRWNGSTWQAVQDAGIAQAIC